VIVLLVTDQTLISNSHTEVKMIDYLATEMNTFICRNADKEKNTQIQNTGCIQNTESDYPGLSSLLRLAF